jgi:hypothetical protein
MEKEKRAAIVLYGGEGTKIGEDPRVDYFNDKTQYSCACTDW